MPKKRSSTKSRIIKAAWNLFYKHGYEQTTVDEIISLLRPQKEPFTTILREKKLFSTHFLICLTKSMKSLQES